MLNSILYTIKKGCGLDPTYTAFDEDIIMHTNTIFMLLNQLGVGPKDPFTITDESATWDQFISDPEKLPAVKTYIVQRVRMLFDPPTNGTVMSAVKESIAELEWRLNVHVDPEDTFEEVIQNE